MWRSFCEALALMLYMRKFPPSESAPEAGLRIESAPVVRITPSERDALQLVAQGTPTSRIGMMLGLVPADIGSFLEALFARLGATSRAEAIRVASRRGLLMPSLNGPAIDSVATEPNEYP
jgi:DNA-binding CsgD family transcriptional regulator